MQKAYRTHMHEQSQIGERALRDVVAELETMGLLETWIDARGREGRVKQLETTIDPEWVQETIETYAAENDQMSFQESAEDAWNCQQ